MTMCNACIDLVGKPAIEESHPALKGDGAFTQQRAMLQFYVCTNKGCDSKLERLVQRGQFGSRNVWKLRGT